MMTAPDPGDPKPSGSYGSGSITMVPVVRKKQPNDFLPHGHDFDLFVTMENIDQEKDVILSSRTGLVYE